MSDYNSKVYLKQGGDELVVESGGKITLKAGSQLNGPSGQAGAIADLVVTGTYATDDDDIAASVNGILAALRAAGIIAT